MKKTTVIIVILCSVFFFACSTEEGIGNDAQEKTFNVSEAIVDDNDTSEQQNEACVTTSLIAGQFHTAGTVTIDIIDGNIIVTYSTNEDWTIVATHLSISECDDIPTNGSGNPKIGHFDYSSTHSEGTNQVIYTISLSELDLGDNFCIAAHAEVVGPTGEETAWAEGLEFSGNSWAMYLEIDSTECDDNDDDDDDDDDVIDV